LYWCVQALSQSRNVEPTNDFFGHPAFLCSALEENGIYTAAWKQIGSDSFSRRIEPSPHSPYSCEYPAWVAPAALVVGVPRVRPPVPDISTIYRVSGDTILRADIISIAVTIHRPSALKTGKEELDRLITQLFKTINRPEPAGLFQSIDAQRYFLSRQPYGIVWFSSVKQDHFAIEGDTLWFRLQQ
jgi:hypothetical protein